MSMGTNIYDFYTQKLKALIMKRCGESVTISDHGNTEQYIFSSKVSVSEATNDYKRLLKVQKLSTVEYMDGHVHRKKAQIFVRDVDTIDGISDSPFNQANVSKSNVKSIAGFKWLLVRKLPTKIAEVEVNDFTQLVLGWTGYRKILSVKISFPTIIGHCRTIPKKPTEEIVVYNDPSIIVDESIYELAKEIKWQDLLNRFKNSVTFFRSLNFDYFCFLAITFDIILL